MALWVKTVLARVKGLTLHPPHSSTNHSELSKSFFFDINPLLFFLQSFSTLLWSGNVRYQVCLSPPRVAFYVSLKMQRILFVIVTYQMQDFIDHLIILERLTVVN